MQYRQATPDVVKIGHETIAEHHAHLLGLRVDFVFMDKVPKKGGKQVWARAKKIGSLPAFLANSQQPASYDGAEDFFVIEIAEEIWHTLKTPAKKALIDHELSHCEIVQGEDDMDAKLTTVGHDVEEFSSILERHGLWRPSLEEFAKAGAEQLSFPDNGEEGDRLSPETLQAARELRDMGAEMTVGSPSEPKPGQTESFTFDSESLGRINEAARHLSEVDPETGEVLERSKVGTV